MNSTFKDIFYHLDDQLTNTADDLSDQSKKQLFNQVKFYIFIQEFLEKITPLLEEEEEIKGYLPFSPGPNSSIGNVGFMGMAYARTEEARNYVKTFNDVRGNRLMIFTDKRMIFMTIVEFLEDQTYYSYPYEAIESIRIKQHTVSYFDWEKRFAPKRVKIHWYTFDFQSGTNIFTETLDEKDYQLLMEKIKTIEPLQKILITDKVQRSSTFDYLFSNINLQLKLFIAVLILAGLLLLIIGWILPLLSFASAPIFESSQHFARLLLHSVTII
ncbi:hypothetical protein BAU15_14420 [Enterococcus sp. JM4C]|uniref:hypothetical protein n=1 Tax=Candidatus Enterococcus huntleyi TaxID=1857217 RepID=UPI001379DE27|nr:hypothetical protein [Enterococcus sp. JM4C]KAF1296895.1 hypothetical protein BAU15_14420 [Enterococcus sp. JM4C]